MNRCARISILLLHFFVPVSSLGGSGGSMTNFRGKYIQYIPSAHWIRSSCKGTFEIMMWNPRTESLFERNPKNLAFSLKKLHNFEKKFRIDHSLIEYSQLNWFFKCPKLESQDFLIISSHKCFSFGTLECYWFIFSKNETASYWNVHVLAPSLVYCDTWNQHIISYYFQLKSYFNCFIIF